MKNSFSNVVMAVTIICLISTTVFATTHNTFRCPNGRIIHINDKLETVRMKCDPPTSATKRTVATYPAPYPPYTVYYEPADVEEWIYNLGPSSFIMYLTFTNGVLTNIESGEYGY